MENLGKFYIDGKWVTPNSKQAMSVINPASEEEIGTVILGNNNDVDLAVKAANLAFHSFSQTTKEDRLKLLKRIHEVTSDRFEELAQAMSTEMGAPITMSREAQADSGLGHLQGFIEALDLSLIHI